jgi:hypothetical protein
MLRVNKKGKSRLQWDKVQDSGTRTAFGTGSQRDTQEGKGRYDLIPTSVLHRLAVHYENGAAKYGDNNWQKGQSLAQYYNSAMRHLQAIKDADLSEDHFAAAIWNVAAMIHHIDAMIDGTLPQELDSFGIVAAVKEQETFEQLREYYNEPVPHSIFPMGTSQWIPVVASGVMPDVPLPSPFDEDRFKEPKHKVYRTTKLDPEELG